MPKPKRAARPKTKGKPVVKRKLARRPSGGPARPGLARPGPARAKTARRPPARPPRPAVPVSLGSIVTIPADAPNLFPGTAPLSARTSSAYPEIKGIVCSIRHLLSGKLVAKTRGPLIGYILEILHDLTFDAQYSAAQNTGGARAVERDRNPAWRRVRELLNETAAGPSPLLTVAQLLSSESSRRALDGWRVVKVRAEAAVVEA